MIRAFKNLAYLLPLVVSCFCGISELSAQDPRIEQMLRSWNVRYQFLANVPMNSNLPELCSPSSFIAECRTHDGSEFKLFLPGVIPIVNGEPVIAFSVLRALPAGMTLQDARDAFSRNGITASWAEINGTQCVGIGVVFYPNRPGNLWDYVLQVNNQAFQILMANWKIPESLDDLLSPLKSTAPQSANAGF